MKPENVRKTNCINEVRVREEINKKTSKTVKRESMTPMVIKLRGKRKEDEKESAGS